MEWIEIKDAARIWGVSYQGAVKCINERGMRTRMNTARGLKGGPRREVCAADVNAETQRRLNDLDASVKHLRAQLTA